jgi:endoglucanase
MTSDYKVQTYSQGITYRGVNLSGAEFKDDGSGAARKGALAPKLQDAVPFIADGMNIFRIPIAWEYLADTNGHINNDEYLQNVKNVVSDLSSHGATIILDLHNYMRYNNNDVSLDYLHTDKKGVDVIGVPGSTVSTAAYATLWGEIAKSFSGTNIMYELMNEPHDVDSALILQNYIAAITSIRTAEGAIHHTILIDGNSWTGMHSWNDDNGNGSSKDLMSNFVNL